MATPEPSGVKAERPTGRMLFQRLFDDAALFRPGLDLLNAVTDHVARRSRSFADLVGPLVLPVSVVADLLRIDHPPLEVALAGRPGDGLEAVVEALAVLREHPGVTVIGVEVEWSAGWHRAASWGTEILGAGSRGTLRSIGVPRAPQLQSALSDIQPHAYGPNPVRASFGTGSTSCVADGPAPNATQLATFIRSCVDHDLSFKLTGGLHHAMSQTTATGDQLGVLNVIAATRWALAHAAEVPEIRSLLAQRDPWQIMDIITRMSDADASVVRAFFTSYGCSRVTDPIGDLAALGLITETTITETHDA